MASGVQNSCNLRRKVLRKDRSSISTVSGSLALMIIAFVIGVGATVIAYNISAITAARSTTSTTVSSGAPAASINQPPTVLPIKIEWCNTDNTGEDRFCPDTITVVQGDIVQLMFIQNDTDTHTFTLSSGQYSFQINTTVAGLENFLQDGATYNASCIDGSYQQDSAGISTTLCVSGSSLLSPSFLTAHGASTFAAAQNGNPAENLGNSSNPITTVPVSDETYYGDSANISSITVPSNATSSEEYGIGAFQASYAGVFEFTCVYHVANGMFGYLIVLPNAYCNTNSTACGINSTAT
jgi:plastocyanin